MAVIAAVGKWRLMPALLGLRKPLSDGQMDGRGVACVCVCGHAGLAHSQIVVAGSSLRDGKWASGALKGHKKERAEMGPGRLDVDKSNAACAMDGVALSRKLEPHVATGSKKIPDREEVDGDDE